MTRWKKAEVCVAYPKVGLQKQLHEAELNNTEQLTCPAIYREND
jgi:hypothetical protein